MPDMPERKKARISRRSLLLGAAGGAVAGGAATAGLFTLRDVARSMLTPPPVAAGAPPVIGRSFQESRPSYASVAKAPDGAPNIIVIVLDDVGFADLGCYGGEIRTPNFDALAGRGVRYANFRTTAMCSPTRAALLTGLNHHSAGVGWLADIDSGYPGYRGDLTLEAMTLPEVLREAGWATYLAGKWHVNNSQSNGPTGPFHNWPTSRGFDHAYWFHGHSIDYFRPGDLFDGTAPVEAPARDDYYICDDLTDRAISWIRTQKAFSPDKPFFLQLAFPGAHSPLQVPAAYRDAYQGAYDAGWDAVRQARLGRQKQLGLVPETTTLPPLSFGARPWGELSPLERKVFARYMEVYAGLVSNLDDNVGRLLATLQELGCLDDTLVVVLSDNGGSGEGTETGSPNVFAPAFGRPVPLEEAAKLYDAMGTDETFPHYPMGWACVSNTPFRLYKQYAHLGGVADPLILSWPKRVADKGAIRSRFVHVIDLFPTLLEAAGVDRPAFYRGQPQKPVEGQSFFANLLAAEAPTRTGQYYELGGNRAYEDGRWRLTTRHTRGEPFEDDVWELYDISVDVNETVDLAAKHPEIVAEMKAKWEAAAARFNVFPLDDRALLLKLVKDRQTRGIRPFWEFRPPVERIPFDVAPLVCGLNHSIEIELERQGDGVLVAHGSKHAGYVIYVADGRLIYEASLSPWSDRIVSSETLPTGPLVVSYRQTMTSRPFDGSGALYVGERKVGERTFDRCLLSPGYDGFSIGADVGNQVSRAYRGPNPIAGTIRRVTIHVEDKPTTPQETLRFLQEMRIRV